ncbi:MAG: glycosyl transferase family 2 [Flavobacteriaceae bacterium]|nr:MAG: glycosyl transferase family 2 [Flavobacteriaceae bacterium]
MKRNEQTISVIIPVLNEEATIGSLISHLRTHSLKTNISEILVIDGGSCDNTIAIATQQKVTVLSSKKGRPIQMNLGAKHAKGSILYFLHADTLPPKSFDEHIIKAIEKGHDSGCFRMRFDTNNVLLKFFASLTKINHRVCRGGDQSLYVKSTLFKQMKGFNEAYLIYEDSEFIRRLYQITNFTVLPQRVVTSARKYRRNGTLRLQYHFGMIHLKNLLGAGPEELCNYYKKHILEQTQ